MGINKAIALQLCSDLKADGAVLQRGWRYHVNTGSTGSSGSTELPEPESGSGSSGSSGSSGGPDNRNIGPDNMGNLHDDDRAPQ